MDPMSDPPPLPYQPTAADPATTAAVANPTPAQAPAHNHPPYAEMITAAISALKERDGSSKRAIAKYMETHYSDLPSTHSALLTHHLKRLKTNGQLFMVKNSYKLPRSAPAHFEGARRPGRPPKPKPDSIQVAVPVFEPIINMNAVPVVVPAAEPQPNVAFGPVNGAAAGSPVGGRGRPPKQGGLKRGPGRPPKSGGLKRGPGRPPKSGGPSGGGGGVGRGRGRPKIAVPAAQERKGPGRPRRRPINLVKGLALGTVAPGAVGVGIPAVFAPVAGKRLRGRPPKAGGEAKRPRNMNVGEAKRPRYMSVGQPKKPRNYSGKPLGRPKKNPSATTVNRSPDSQLLVAYLDLKAKLENLQSRITQTANLIKPSLNNEAAINALQELELIAMSVTTTPAAVAQNQQQQQQQPPPEQYPQQPPPEQYPQLPLQS